MTTYDRDRGHGVLYRIVDGRAELVAGGTPPAGTPPLLKQPEGVAVDRAGHSTSPTASTAPCYASTPPARCSSRAG